MEGTCFKSIVTCCDNPSTCFAPSQAQHQPVEEPSGEDQKPEDIW